MYKQKKALVKKGMVITMFDTRKFGGFLSQLRKNADMTQSELADKLNLTRQAISKYELGDSFPDISILILISEIYSISVDKLINAGEPTRGEALLFCKAVAGSDTDDCNGVINGVEDIKSIAPLLKPSALGKIADKYLKEGINLSHVVELSEFLNDDSTLLLLERANIDGLNDELIRRLFPFLDTASKMTVFDRILTGVMDWRLISLLLPYAEFMFEPLEAAVIEGALPWEALDELRKGHEKLYKLKQESY